MGRLRDISRREGENPFEPAFLTDVAGPRDQTDRLISPNKWNGSVCSRAFFMLQNYERLEPKPDQPAEFASPLNAGLSGRESDILAPG